MHYANPKNKNDARECPVCGRKVEGQASIRGRERDGTPWSGQYVIFECGLMVVLRRGRPEVWNPCECGKGVIDAEVIDARWLTPEEIAAKQAKERQELAEFEQGGRFQYVRPFFTASSTDTL